MSDASLFVLGALTLLSTPGPTNTLLATSGAVIGFRRSLRLIAGEVLGYLLAIGLLAVVVGPVWHASPGARAALKICCGLYLLTVAVKLWRGGRPETAQGGDVSVRSVFLTTLLNPKAAVFAFVVIPHLAAGEHAAALPYLAALSGLIALAGTGWIALGALITLGGGRHLDPRRARRIGAVPLVTFAALLMGSTAVEIAALLDAGGRSTL